MIQRRTIFETERLIVRLYDLYDEESFFRLNGDEEIVRYIRPAKNREECNLFLREVIQFSESNPLIGRWAVDQKATGINIGMFAIIPVDNTGKLQLGYSLLKDSWGKGYATELTVEGIHYFFSQFDRSEIYALTESANIASQKVLVKCGFQVNETYTKNEKEVIEYIYLKIGENPI
ncbi:MAG: GNAT family N-acetyltransferase [Bacteroidetes bacterium]|nr:GNAT family N-acetyltransferase [Bacteroidota bacterium]